MKPIRAFFGIKLPDALEHPLTKILSSLQQSIPSNRLHWSLLANLHVTLQFIREVKLEDIPELVDQASIQLQKESVFELELGKLELFPTPKHPKILSLEAKPNAILAHMAGVIGEVMQRLNYSPEERAYRGHLTLARLKNYHLEHTALEQIELPVIPKALVTEVYLFESRAGKDASVYIPLAQIKLS